MKKKKEKKKPLTASERRMQELMKQNPGMFGAVKQRDKK